MVVLAPAPRAEAEPADGIGCGDAGQHGQGGRDVCLAAIFGEDELGDLEERAGLVAAGAAFGRRARHDTTGAAGGHGSPRSSWRRRSP